MPHDIAGRFEADYCLAPRVADSPDATLWHGRDLLSGHPCTLLLRPRHSHPHDTAGTERPLFDTLMRHTRESAAMLTHPHIHAPYGWAINPYTEAIAWPAPAGASLHDLREHGGALSPAAVAVILGQQLRALAHLHRVGLVHRHVTTRTIGVTPTGDGGLRSHLWHAEHAWSTDDLRYAVPRNDHPAHSRTPHHHDHSREAHARSLRELALTLITTLTGTRATTPRAITRALRPQPRAIAHALALLAINDGRLGPRSANAALELVPYVAPATPLTFADGAAIPGHDDASWVRESWAPLKPADHSASSGAAERASS